MIQTNTVVQTHLLNNDRNGTLERMFRGILDNLYESGYLACRPGKIEVLNTHSVNNTPLFEIRTEFLE